VALRCFDTRISSLSAIRLSSRVSRLLSSLIFVISISHLVYFCMQYSHYLSGTCRVHVGYMSGTCREELSETNCALRRIDSGPDSSPDSGPKLSPELTPELCPELTLTPSSWPGILACPVGQLTWAALTMQSNIKDSTFSVRYGIFANGLSAHWITVHHFTILPC